MSVAVVKLTPSGVQSVTIEAVFLNRMCDFLAKTCVGVCVFWMGRCSTFGYSARQRRWRRFWCRCGMRLLASAALQVDTPSLATSCFVRQPVYTDGD